MINRPYLRWIGYLVAIVLAGSAVPHLYDLDNPTAYIASWRNIYNFTSAAFLLLVGMLIFRVASSPSPVVRQQARVILWSIILAFGPIVGWMLLTAIIPSNFSPVILLMTVFFPIVTGYTILRQRLLQTDYLVRQGILYATLSVLTIGGYALLVSGLSLIFGGAMQATHPLVIGTMVFLLALLLNPLRNRVQQAIDAIFFRGQRAYAEHLQTFTRELTAAPDLTSITRALHQRVAATLAPDRIHIYLYDPLSEQYTSTQGEDGRPSSDIRFGAQSPLAQHLHRERHPLYLAGMSPPSDLEPERTRLALLGAHLFVPMLAKDRPLGWIALGPRLSGQPYTHQDLLFLENLCDQAAVAIERVQTLADMERRVQEMNALMRIAQGVNITLAFDDILELIYAQTCQIIPATDFHITLHQKDAGYFYYAFCLEDNERLRSRENTPLPALTGLSQVVIRTGRPLLTHDYGRECQSRNVVPALTGVYAWMGVPLNAGAETIGALSVGSRETGVTYTRAQLNLLQAIADQTAGAIVKARLLQESERRARQLTTLNEITRQLTSTLELEPLLQNMLESAVRILNCEAGSLFLVDEETDELVFKVTTGPVARNLLGQRLPPGSGIVGRAVTMRAPVIVNDVQHSAGWFSQTDEQTGFVTKAVLAVPLEAKERVIGVIEVINKRDGLPFGEDDQNLLTAFASQAAIAIENARLYTLTDQELAARVEELSVMQRIDRELNASLEIERAMRITLEWAMRQSDADAGMIGILEEDGLRLMAHQGYGDLLAAYTDRPLPLDRPALRAAIEARQPQRLTLSADGGGLLPGARSQIVVPIRREADVIGLILLECLTDDKSDRPLTFLNRLSDHAAIAISNAQLYAEVQAANLAKSEFVSLVAHELKNPMTSIKGYTELLAAGAVGPINESQANFLNTIRSNVERMATLVSDLNDQSKIEAGRLRLEFKAVDVREVVDEVLRSSKRQIEEKKQTVTLQLADDLPRVWADRTRLGQVITNLVSNANKYTPEGGKIVIGAEESDNHWDPRGASRVVHIWVQDNGIGISPEDQRKIFQKFFRSEDEKAREAPGTGLGLNISKSLVEMQGGRMWFESEFRKGTTFHFTVPVAEEE